MNPERWQKVKVIVEDALEIAPPARPSFLDKSCAGDFLLRREVEQLLDIEIANEDPLEQNIFDSAMPLISENDHLIGTQIGNYKILEKIGAGGMGAVYLAKHRDKSFEHNVAVKVIRPELLSEVGLQRFYNERQILASLKHSNIAHLIDGGMTENNQPYLAMEYVAGENITDYTTSEKLTLDERLNLFRKVCAAVSFAHRNLIIHRDLKPSNILVTETGEPKLLDFGIAKLLNEETSAESATRNFAFTPEYASPEQVRGEKLTTATDVYSLGIILYELLTGCRPIETESRNISEIIKSICEIEPARPSSIVSASLNQNKNLTTENQVQKTKKIAQSLKSNIGNPKLLKGDLDNIVLKSLRKEPEHRYDSVGKFAEDIRRYQTGLPITARVATWSYRTQKFVHRNRIAVAAAGLIFLSLLGGLLATLYQANKAQRRFDDVRMLANSFLFEFHDAIETLPGSTPARELVVRRALEYLDKLAQESAGDDLTLQRELAAAYDKIGKIQGNSYYLNLGDTEGATKSAETALQIRENLIGRNSQNQDLQFELAQSYQAVGDMRGAINELENALAYYKKSFAINEKLVAEKPENLDYLFAFAENHARIGDVSGLEGYANLGDLPSAIDHYRRAVALGEKLTAADHASEKDSRSRQDSLATWTTNLSQLESTAGDNQAAILNAEKAIAVYEKITAANPNNAAHKINLLAAYNFIRFPLCEEMRFEEAAENLIRAVESLEQMSAADPRNAFIRRSLSVSLNALGRTQTEMRNATAALENHRKAMQISEELLAADPKSSENARDVASTLEFTGNAQIVAGDYKSALASYQNALTIHENLMAAGGSSDLSQIYSGIGKCLAANGNLPEAAETFRQAISTAEKSAQKSPLNVRKQSRLAIYYFEGGMLKAKLSKTLAGEERTAIARQAKALLEKSSRIFDDLQSTDKLSKINGEFPHEVKDELKSLIKMPI